MSVAKILKEEGLVSFCEDRGISDQELAYIALLQMMDCDHRVIAFGALHYGPDRMVQLHCALHELEERVENGEEGLNLTMRVELDMPSSSAVKH